MANNNEYSDNKAKKLLLVVILCLVGTTISIALNAGKRIKVTICVLLRRIVYYVPFFVRR